MDTLGDVFDWAFFWSVFGNFMTTISPFVLITVAITAVGLLAVVIIKAVRTSRS